MRKRTGRCGWAAWGCAAFVAGVLGLAPVEPSDAPEQTEGAPLLMGPRVISEPGEGGGPARTESMTSDKPTLIERSFNGSMKRLDERPEIAALERLTLSEGERAAVHEVLTLRVASVRRVLDESMDLFLEVQGLRQSGVLGGSLVAGERRGTDSDERRAAMEKLAALRERIMPLLEPALLEQLCEVLEPENGAALRALVESYRAALIGEELATARGKRATGLGGVNDEDAARERRAEVTPLALRRFETNQTLREMARSLAAEVAERRERLDALLTTVGASPEQAEEIRRIAVEAGLGNGPADARAQDRRAEALRKILAQLTPEQRRRWIESRRAAEN